MIGIIGAMEEENRILLENMTEKTEETHFHLVFTRGKIENQDVVLVQSGIGKVNSAIATAFIIDRYRPDFVINTGSAGGLNAALHVGDVVVADKVAYHDVDATAFGYSVGQVPQMPHYYTADKKIVEKLRGQLKKSVCMLCKGRLFQAILSSLPKAAQAASRNISLMPMRPKWRAHQSPKLVTYWAHPSQSSVPFRTEQAMARR